MVILSFVNANVFLQTMRLGICFVVRSLVGVLPSKFHYQPILALDIHGVDVALDDILQNYIAKDDQMMNAKTPWRGPREKSILLIQMLIQALTMPGDVVLDYTPATGMLLTGMNP